MVHVMSAADFLPAGEHGFFRIVRGGNYNPGTTYWAVPNIPSF